MVSVAAASVTQQAGPVYGAAMAWEQSKERVISRECAWCGAAFEPGRRAGHQRYCTRACRQRAYEVRTAERRRERDVGAGRVRTSGDPVREVVERHTVRTVVRTGPPRPVAVPPPAPPDPPRARELQEHIEAAAAAVRSGRIGPWDHRRLYGAVMAVLAALDAEHPGGLEALRRRR